MNRSRILVVAAALLLVPETARSTEDDPANGCPTNDCCSFERAWYAPVTQGWLCLGGPNHCQPGCPTGRREGLPIPGSGTCVVCNSNNPETLDIQHLCGECLFWDCPLPVPVFECHFDSICYYPIDCDGSTMMGMKCKTVQVGTVIRVQQQSFATVDCPF